MDDLQLSDALQRYFSDIFVCCDDDKTGKASLTKTIELIKSANVPEDIIKQRTIKNDSVIHRVKQISEICWNPCTTHLNRRQFYSALKLVAAYLANIPINSDLVTLRIDLPLPKFSWIHQENKSPIPDLIEFQSDISKYKEQVDMTSTDSEADSETIRNGSPDASSTASDSPTPTNSVQDRSWAVTGAWQGLVSEEQRQLLGTEEESSDKHSSEEDTEVSNEVWTITSEQKEYYTNQFRALQPDTNALLAGPVARMFFEKSRLPVHELRRIWQLADVTKDGALSLTEFMTAMHLVVLRRNHIELPETLPASLAPTSETPVSVSPETEPILSPQTKDTAKEWTKFVDSPTSSVSSPGPKPVNFDFQKVTLDKDSKILHPVPLRLTPETSNNHVDDATADAIDLHSPKKFLDTAAVQATQNMQSLSLTPQQQQNNSAIQRPQPKKIALPGPGAIPPPPPIAQPPSSAPVPVEEGPVSLPAFPPPKKEKPPPPPPRPFKTHGRSSSLDLNRLSKPQGPPQVPPRVSPNMQGTKKLINQRSEGDAVSETPFANFEQFENVTEGIFPGDVYEAERKKLFAQFCVPEPSDEAAPRKHGAFEIYRKPQTKSGRESPVTAEEKAKWQLFKQLQDENTVLLRICQELSQELAELKEERMSLKVKLEKQLNGG